MHLLVKLTPSTPPAPPTQQVFELSPPKPPTRNPELEAALQTPSKRLQFQGVPVVPYVPIYLPHMLGGRGKASHSKLWVDTHFGARYIYQLENCVGQWYCRPITGWGVGTPDEFLETTDAPHARHAFFSETLVPVDPGTMICLEKLLEATGMGMCCDKGYEWVVSVIVELDMGPLENESRSQGSACVPLKVCRGGKLQEVFRTAAGGRLRAEFRLTQVPRAAGGVEETYSYGVARSEDKALEGLIWFPDAGEELWLLPFPGTMVKLGEGRPRGGAVVG